MAQAATAGQKRKRDGDRQSGQRNKSNYKGKQRATQDHNEQGITSGKLHHSLQLVTRAAKKARTFEIQKLVRKIKSDKAKAALPAGTSKLHAELEEILTTLKSIDADELASQALSSKLHKDKTGLQDNAEVQTFITAHPTKISDGTSVIAKAQNRILANKVLVQCLQEVLDSLRQKAGIVNAPSAKNKDSSKATQDDKKSKLTAQNLAKVTIDPARKERLTKRSNADVVEDETSSEEDSDEEGSGATASHISAEESIPDDEFAGIEKTSDEDSDEVSEGSISGASASSFPTVRKQKEKSQIAANETTKSKKQRVADSSPPTTSAFLPSLAAGYTLGDSDGSVYSDDDAADTKPARKNRRGQRARQLIWERKYGKNAKHVIKSQERNAETEEARQKAKAEKEIEYLKKTGRYVYGVESNLTKPKEGKESRTWTAALPSDNANEKMSALLAAEAAKAKKAPPSNALHPSWEARKKAKEAQASLASAKPAGKKIVFD